MQLGERIAAVVHALDLEVLGVQILGEHLAQLAVVVHEQNARLARRGGLGMRIVERARHGLISRARAQFPAIFERQ